MKFLKIGGDTAKTKKTPFVAKESSESRRGVLLFSSFCKSAESGSKHDVSCGELEKLSVASFRKCLISRFHFFSQQRLVGVKTLQSVSIRSSFPVGRQNELLFRKKTFRQQKLNSAEPALLGVTFQKNKFLFGRHNNWEFVEISKINVYHRLFWDYLENTIQLEKNWLLILKLCTKKTKFTTCKWKIKSVRIK